MAKFQAGKVSVEIDDSLRRLMESMAGQSGQLALSELQDMVGEVYDEAHRRWPVDSGRSRAQLRTYVKVSGDKVTVGVTNDAPYVWFIKVRKVHVWSRYVTRPLKRKVKREIRRVARAVAGGK